jgi:hypothetical protein
MAPRGGQVNSDQEKISTSHVECFTLSTRMPNVGCFALHAGADESPYARGMTTREIAAQLGEPYGHPVCE